MFDYSVSELAGAMGAMVFNGGSQPVINSVSIDSRMVKKGDLFFALCGERFDGHDFLPAAVRAGAAGVVLEHVVEGLPAGVAVFLVTDTLTALQGLARHNRLRAGIPVIGVTGSSGKTSTRDLICSVLATKYNTLKTEGNFNNELGMPLTLLRLDGSQQMAVVEMAMRGEGEIDLLGTIALPSAAVITNIGEAHLELLGSVDRIARSKGEILDHVPEQGFAVLHGESPFIKREARRCRGRVIFFGENPRHDIYVDGIIPFAGGNRFTACFQGKTEEFSIPLPGRHNVINCLAAIAVGLELGLTVREIRDGLAVAGLSAMRLEISDYNGIKIINDTYNANPASMKAAIQVLQETAGAGGRKIAVLGDMFELGGKSDAGHIEVGRAASEAGVDLLAAVGDQARLFGSGAVGAGLPKERVRYYKSPVEAARELKNVIKPGDIILVKGSRGMKMEEFVFTLRGDNPGN